MAGAELFLAMLTQVREWVTGISTQQAKADERVMAALEAIAHAANQTRRYLALTRDQPAQRDRQRESELSQFWEIAGARVYPLNRDLTERCLLKAEYWSDPLGWTAAEKDSSRIGLDSLYAEAKTLLLSA